MNILKELGRNSPVGPYFLKNPSFRVISSSPSVRLPSSHLSNSIEMGKLGRGNNCTSHQAKKEALDEFERPRRSLLNNIKPSRSQLQNSREECMKLVGTENEWYRDNVRQRIMSWNDYESNAFYKRMKGTTIYKDYIVPPVPNIKTPLSSKRVMELLHGTWSNTKLERITKVLNYLYQFPDQRITESYTDLKEGICSILESGPDDKSSSIAFLCALTYLDSITLKKLILSTRFSQALNTYCQTLLPQLCINEIFRVFHCYRLIGNPRIQWAASFPQCALITLERQMLTFTKSQLVQLCYFISVCRKRLMRMNKLQQHIEKCTEEMTLGELALVISAFFKANAHLTDNFILSTIVTKAKQGRKTIDQLYLTIIFKSLRSHEGLLKQPILMLFLEFLHLEKITTKSFGHLVHYAAAYLIYQEVLMQEIRNRFAHTINLARLKDIAKLMMYVCRVGYSSEHADPICNVAIDHLRSTCHTLRANEIKSYPFAFISCMAHLSSMGKYDPELLDLIFNEAFLHDLHPSSLNDSAWWDIWYLDSNIRTDLPEYRHTRLPESYRGHFAKVAARNCAAASKDQRVYHIEQFLSSVAFTLKNMFGCPSCVLVGRVLPQYTQSNIIICLDEATGRGVPIASGFLPEILLEPRFVKCKDVTWLALELIYKVKEILGTSDPYGLQQFKLRHLQSLGYIPHIIMESNWMRHVTESERVSYLGKLIANRNRPSQQQN